MTRDFMADLEARVNAAAARIEELQRENRRLEQELAQNPLRDFSPPPPPPPAAPPATRAGKVDRAEKAWTKERDEIRRRLEALIARLESLLS
jgi:cell division septum initiation protein DivIVA